MKAYVLSLACLGLAGCQAGPDGAENAPGTSPEGFSAITAEETIYFLGTEPFWGGEVQGSRLTYDTPEDPDGTQIPVKRFTGQGGLGFSGTLDDTSFDMTVTPGDCSDGMSDRTYPYTVTLMLGAEQRSGCAHTDREPVEGPERP